MALPESPFWIVWREGGRSPTFKHQTAENAEKEAIRLARENPGHTFYVLPVASAVSCGRLEIERFATDDGIPF